MTRIGEVIASASKKWTVWAGLVILAWPDLQPIVLPVAEDVIGPAASDALARLAGIAVIMLRMRNAVELK